MSNKPKLELTWIGKDEQPKLEPRILVEDPEKSYGDKHTENMLIYGDNLLALKALEQDFTGRIKCIYIDPPYNTGSRIDSDGELVGYDDGLEHSEWLNMMKPRLELLNKLLDIDGYIVIQIDDNEFARLYLLMSEIFEEKNLKTICVKMSEATGLKMAHVSSNGIIPKLKEYLIIAKKDGIKKLRLDKIAKEKWDNEYKSFLLDITKEEVEFIKAVRDSESRDAEEIIKCDSILAKINVKSVGDLYNENNITSIKDKINYNFENAWRIAQFVSMSGGAKLIADEKKKENNNPFFSIITPQNKMYFIRNDYDSSIEIPRIKLLFADDYLSVHPGDFWQDIKTTGLDNEGGVDFKRGKKPEALIKRVIGMATKKGDWVLDSFAGSGTTGAVAQKMERKWIMIEMANHCYSHTIPRLQNVCDGIDQQGISKSVNWKGGGGFKHYYLAPSLLKLDKYGNWVIDEKYNANMLAAAMAKHCNFKYQPSEDVYWKQGQSSEKDFIYTTTQFITVAKLDQIHEEMQLDESLLICCKTYSKPCEIRYTNITVKKIPQMLLGKCEFGREDYSLNIISMPRNENEPEFVPRGPDKKKIVKEELDTPDLFEENNGEDK